VRGYIGEIKKPMLVFRRRRFFVLRAETVVFSPWHSVWMFLENFLVGEGRKRRKANKELEIFVKIGLVGMWFLI
jgi:hypothetical protein